MHWLICLNLVQSVKSVIFQIDDARPFLTIGGVPVKWDSGAGAEWVLSSLLVRIHPRGLFFKPQAWHTRDLTGLGWDTVQCTPSAYGLCQTDVSVVFPSDSVPVINQDREDECPSTATNRIVTSELRYDVSACDVLDAGRDFVYAENAIHSARTALPDWIYWIECILVVYLVRCLSKYVLASLTKRKQRGGKAGSRNIQINGKGNDETDAELSELLPDPYLCLSACAACTILIITQGDACFVTEEDLIFYWFVVFYIAAYGGIFLSTRLLKHASGWWDVKTKIFPLNVLADMAKVGRDPPFYNLLAGVLQLVASRLFAGAETPYNPPLLFVVAVRALVKCRRGLDPLRCATLMLDAWMLALMCTLAFGPDPQYLLAIFAAAAAWVDFLV